MRFLVKIILSVFVGGLPVFAIADERNADEYYWQGVAAMDQGALEIAINAFELALLENPRHQGAQLDLAIALCQIGDKVQCESQFEQLLSYSSNNPSIDLHARQTIEQLYQQLKPKQWQHQTQLAIGNSSNINYGIASSQLGLNVNGIPLSLELSPHSRAQSSAYTDITHISQWQSHQKMERWEIQANLYARQLESINQNQITLGQVMLKKRYPLGFDQQSISYGVGFTHLSYQSIGQSDYVYHAPKVRFEWQAPNNIGKPTWYYQHEQRLFDHARSTDIDSLGVLFEPFRYTALVIEYIADDNPERLGGNTHRWQWQGSLQIPITNAFAWQTQLFGILSQDEQRYSPPLVDVARSTSQTGWQTGLLYRMNNDWQGYCHYHRYHQQANHALFEWQEEGVQCGAFVVY